MPSGGGPVFFEFFGDFGDCDGDIAAGLDPPADGLGHAADRLGDRAIGGIGEEAGDQPVDGLVVGDRREDLIIGAALASPVIDERVGLDRAPSSPAKSRRIRTARESVSSASRAANGMITGLRSIASSRSKAWKARRSGSSITFIAARASIFRILAVTSGLSSIE